jgi:hypothetical protein
MTSALAYPPTLRNRAAAQWQQQVFLRAAVSSIVLCAALAPAAAGQNAATTVLDQATPCRNSSRVLKFECIKNPFPPRLQKIESLLAPARLIRHDDDLAIVMNNMTLSANGKQLVMYLELSREQAGNLLRKHLSLP